jgi:TPR repeat protein
MITFLEKYKKYKLKYKKLKNHLGGNINRIKAEELYKSRKYTEAFKLYQFAMEQGDIDSYYKVVRMYEDGIGVEKDNSKANKIRQKADKLNFEKNLKTMEEGDIY